MTRERPDIKVGQRWADGGRIVKVIGVGERYVYTEVVKNAEHHTRDTTGRTYRILREGLLRNYRLLEDTPMSAITSFLNSLVPELKKRLENELEKITSFSIAKQIARLMTKAADAAVKAGVGVLPADQVPTFTAAYLQTISEELREFEGAIGVYIPLQVAVEVAKKAHGKNSPEAEEARKRRVIGLAGYKEEVRDLLLATSGQRPRD